MSSMYSHWAHYLYYSSRVLVYRILQLLQYATVMLSHFYVMYLVIFSSFFIFLLLRSLNTWNKKFAPKEYICKSIHFKIVPMEAHHEILYFYESIASVNIYLCTWLLNISFSCAEIFELYFCWKLSSVDLLSSDTHFLHF